MSVWPNGEYPAAEQLAWARWAEEHDCYGIWYADHYMPNTGDTSLAPGDYHEAWGLIPAAAAITDRIRVGPLVSPTSVHHPAVLANRAATVDHVSRGRMVLGLGAGWQINEHHVYGIELETPKRRVDRFEESIEIIVSLLNNQHTSFNGSIYTIDNAPCDPKPVQHPLPILVGTSSPRMMRITARWAGEWNTWGNAALACENRERFADACQAVGSAIERKSTSVNALITVTDNIETIDEIADGPVGTRSIAGPIDAVGEQLTVYRDAGFDEFIVPTWNLGESHQQRVEAMSQIKHELFDRL